VFHGKKEGLFRTQKKGGAATGGQEERIFVPTGKLDIFEPKKTPTFCEKEKKMGTIWKKKKKERRGDQQVGARTQKLITSAVRRPKKRKRPNPRKKKNCTLRERPGPENLGRSTPRARGMLAKKKEKGPKKRHKKRSYAEVQSGKPPSRPQERREGEDFCSSRRGKT